MSTDEVNNIFLAVFGLAIAGGAGAYIGWTGAKYVEAWASLVFDTAWALLRALARRIFR